MVWCRRYSPYLVCVLCVQSMDDFQSKLLDPLSNQAQLEERIKECKNVIEQHNAEIAQHDAKIVELEEQRAKKGELPGCHTNGHHVVMVTACVVHLVVMVTIAMPVCNGNQLSAILAVGALLCILAWYRPIAVHPLPNYWVHGKCGEQPRSNHKSYCYTGIVDCY